METSDNRGIGFIASDGEGVFRPPKSCEHGIFTYGKMAHPPHPNIPQMWERTAVAKTLNLFNIGEIRCDELVVMR